MKLRYHTIVGGRYFKSGEDVPDDLVSPSIAKYAVDPSPLAPEASAQCRKASKHAAQAHKIDAGTVLIGREGPR